jgi:hypothetical protein
MNEAGESEESSSAREGMMNVGTVEHSSSPPELEQATVSKNSAVNVVVNKDAESSPSVEFYKGIRLKLKNIVEKFDFFTVTETKESSTGKIRPKVKCEVCCTYEEAAKKQTRNKLVPMASGVLAYGQEKLKQLIDHTHSEAHKSALEAKKLDEVWAENSMKHPWINSTLKHKQEVVEMLIRMCMDAYNDCIVERCSAYSWPARSLTQLATESFIGHIRSQGMNSDFLPYKPSSIDLHYRDPVYYCEMVKCVGQVELQKLKTMMESCIVYSMQVDGSVSKFMADNKFVSCRALMPTNEVRTAFLSMVSPESNGATGLLEAVSNTLERCGASLDKLIGVTTDGEAANTGKSKGLWKLLQDFSGKTLLTFWCAAHRSDLALEEIISTVPELKRWSSECVSVASYFRCSKNKKKMLHSFIPTAKKFPKYHEVRFAQHTLTLIDAILGNLEGCKETWEKLAEAGDSRKEQSEAKGFLRTWDPRMVKPLDVC